MLKNPADSQYRFAVSVWVKTPSTADTAGSYWSIPERESTLASTSPLASESSGCERFQANSWAFVLVLYEIVDNGGSRVALQKNKIWRSGGKSTSCTDASHCNPCHSTLSQLLLPLIVDGTTQTEFRVDHNQGSFTFQTLNLMSGMVKDTNDLAFKEAQVFLGGDITLSTQIDFLGFTGPAMNLRFVWRKATPANQKEFWKRFNPEGFSLGDKTIIDAFDNVMNFKGTKRLSKTFFMQGSIIGKNAGELETGDAIAVRLEFQLTLSGTNSRKRTHDIRFRVDRNGNGFYSPGLHLDGRDLSKHFVKPVMTHKILSDKILDFSYSYTCFQTEPNVYYTFGSMRVKVRGEEKGIGGEKFFRVEFSDLGSESIDDEDAHVQINSTPNRAGIEWSLQAPYTEAILNKFEIQVKYAKVFEGGFSNFDSKEALEMTDSTQKGF